MDFEILNLEVGTNFVEIEFTCGDSQDIEMKFFQTKRELINNSLRVFGFSLTDVDLNDYEY